MANATYSSMTGPKGSVDAFEIEARLAERATQNLADLTNVTVHNRSGSETRPASADSIYVNAGAENRFGLHHR